MHLYPPVNLFNMTQCLSMSTFILSSKSAQFFDTRIIIIIIFIFDSYQLIIIIIMGFIKRYLQACRGYEISHTYPYPQIFAWISMDLSISRRLSCLDSTCSHLISTKHSRGKGVHPQRQRRRYSPPKIVIIIWNCLRINTYLH